MKITCTLVALLISLLWASPPTGTRQGFFTISAGSRLTLDGSTNVNTFSCLCEKSFANLPFRYEWLSSNTRTRKFHDTILLLPVKYLDCGNARMNKDLQKTLNADRYPHIKLQLIQTDERNCNPTLRPGEWGRITATLAIEINGCTNTYSLTVLASPVNGNAFRIMGSKKLHMTDFGIDPPTAVFGMIKVHDEIKISFDLILEVSTNF